MTALKPAQAAPGWADIRVGKAYSLEGQLVHLLRILSAEDLLIQFQSGDTKRVFVHELRPVSEAADPPRADLANQGSTESEKCRKGKADLQSFSQAEIDKAQEILNFIEPLMAKQGRKRADVVKVANANGYSVSRVYAFISDYRNSGHWSAFVPAARGPRPGSHRLSPEVEAVIDSVVKDKYLNPLKLTPKAIIEEIDLLLEDRGLPRVHGNTIRNRLKEISPKIELKTRGNAELAGQLFEQRDGEYDEANAPLKVVQIDHVKLDRIIVDKETRMPLKARAWLTLAIDIYTRMILGYYLSLDAPSAFGVGVCLYMAIMPKRELLATLKLPGQWPVYGKLGKIHSDNAKEFKGEMLKAAAKEHGMDLQLRPTKRPHYGAYIERLVGKVNTELHKRRGTTHSNHNVSPDYDPVKNAVYTLEETEKDIVDWIVNCYVVTKHHALNMTPLQKWERSILGDAKTPGVGLPVIPKDPEKLRLDFLPFERRIIHPYGVEIDVQEFSGDCLQGHINAPDPDDRKKKKKFIFRIDPRSYKKIWFFDDLAKEYFVVPLKARDLPDMSWSEYNAIRSRMRKEGLNATDYDSVNAYLRRVREREQEAVAATANVRKPAQGKAAASAQRSRDNFAPGAAKYAEVPTTAESKLPEPRVTSYDDLFEQTIVPFE